MLFVIMTRLANRSIFRKIIKFIDGKIGRNLRKAKIVINIQNTTQVMIIFYQCCLYNFQIAMV